MLDLTYLGVQFGKNASFADVRDALGRPFGACENAHTGQKGVILTSASERCELFARPLPPNAYVGDIRFRRPDSAPLDEPVYRGFLTLEDSLDASVVQVVDEAAQSFAGRFARA
jgi:hypothetical protein